MYTLLLPSSIRSRRMLQRLGTTGVSSWPNFIIKAEAKSEIYRLPDSKVVGLKAYQGGRGVGGKKGEDKGRQD